MPHLPLSNLRGLAVLVSASAACAASHAVQFTTLNPAYQQQIFTGPLVGGPGMAWTAGGNLLTRDGSQILEYHLAASAVHQGTNIHPSIATHGISGLIASGYGIANSTDGYIYSATGNGLQRIDPVTWTVTTPGANLPGISNSIAVGGGYGVTVLPDGRVVYVAGSGTNEIYLYNPVAQTNALIYTAPALIDDIQASPTGEIALAGQGNNSLIIINAAGTVLTSFATTTFPDGLAFGFGAAVYKLFSNDNMGTITEYDFTPGYLSLLSSATIASGGSYGDLAAVGPDCALYVSQFYNGGFHGSALFGTRWDNNVVNNEPSIVRIASAVPGVCAFAGPSTGGHVDEPPAALLVAAALVGAAAAGLRRRRPRC
jgi:hypothetical protein